MFLQIVCALLLLATASAAVQASGSRKLHAKPAKAGPAVSRQSPVKDCTRLNGRSGYYGNPWCNEAEQLRWDKYDAQKRGW